MLAPTQRFGSRVDAYVKYRPSYPRVVLEALEAQCGLSSSSAIADVGSGTGISSELFLELGCRVFAVEPNGAMRAAAEARLKDRAGFVSVDGRAEQTGLPEASVDFVVAAQAFHWFDADACRREFARILRRAGFIVLLWNERLVEATPFLAAYEALLRRHSEDYARVNHADRVTPEVLARFFSPAPLRELGFDHRQDFDRQGLIGRALSSSYVPEAGDPAHAPFLRELERLFEQHQHDGHVSFEYRTRVFFAPVEGAGS